ncbi:MAG TPA: c-type cytochrome [Alphaproteobacteria bacterium]|nr:c-type cytochrome [Alphaproteobacteria bacterium]
MNSMEINKVAAAVLTAGVIAMMLGLFARILIPAHEGHGEAGPNLFAELSPAEVQAPTEPEGPEPIAPFLATVSADAGSSVARRCTSCHSFEPGGPHKVGPNLANIVGADKAARDFAYSGALDEMEGDWGYQELNLFLYDPRDYVPGTKMSFAGLKDPEDRAAIIAYMRSFTENPPPLPEPEAAEAGEEAPAAEGGDQSPAGGDGTPAEGGSQ